MDKYTSKRTIAYDYISRYSAVPVYYDTQNKRQVYGIGQQMRKNTSYVSHKVKSGDTLDSLSLKYYNNPTYWWVIAYFNTILDPFESLHPTYSVLKIPNITSIVFSDDQKRG